MPPLGNRFEFSVPENDYLSWVYQESMDIITINPLIDIRYNRY